MKNKTLKTILAGAAAAAMLLGGTAVYAEETTESTAEAVTEAAGEEAEAEAEEDYTTGDASLDNVRNQDEIGEKELLVISFGTSF